MELSNYMVKLINNRNFILAIICLCQLSACTTTKWAVIQNSTDSPLQIKGEFTHSQELNVSLEAEGHSTWRYEQSSFDSSRIDERLKSIQATTESGCIIIYDRDAIEQRVPDESWVFNIEQQDLTDACALQGK